MNILLEIILLIFVFLIGLCFGSFGSVILIRLKNGFNKKSIKSILFGRSKCVTCKHKLSFINLIPIFSFFRQKGKCTFCKAKISNIYFVLEILSGFVFVLTYFFVLYLLPISQVYAMFVNVVFWFFVNWLLVLLIVFDVKKYELHVSVWLILTFFVLFMQFVGIIGNYKIAFWGSLLFGILFYLLYFLSKIYVKYRYKNVFVKELGGDKLVEGIGEGDVMLSFSLGALMPFVMGYNNIVFSFFNLFNIFLFFIVISCLVALIYFFVKKYIGYLQTKLDNHIHNEIDDKTNNKIDVVPFIPSMIIGFWITFLFLSKFSFLFF